MAQQPPAPPVPPAPPQAPPATEAGGPIEDTAIGQKFILYGILVYIVAIVLQVAVDPIFGLVALGTVVLGIVGLLKLSDGMGWSTGVKVLLIVLLFVPLAALIMLALVNGKATEKLKAAGYKVGLMGARKP